LEQNSRHVSVLLSFFTAFALFKFIPKSSENNLWYIPIAIHLVFETARNTVHLK
jgi:hypothetical protein